MFAKSVSLDLKYPVCRDRDVRDIMSSKMEEYISSSLIDVGSRWGRLIASGYSVSDLFFSPLLFLSLFIFATTLLQRCLLVNDSSRVTVVVHGYGLSNLVRSNVKEVKIKEATTIS